MNCSGFARPGEILAIMGPSGSGKTSLLNFLTRRLAIESSRQSLSGTVQCNNKAVSKQNFGEFGAFVEQDDILLSTMTPRESFRFAARLRTNYSPPEIEDKIAKTVQELGLEQC